MVKILVLGYGAVGSVIIRDLVESPRVSKVIVGARNIEKAKQCINEIGSDKLSAQHIDVTKSEDLVRKMIGFDAVANAAPYEHIVDVARAAIRAKVHLTDLGGLYDYTKRILELNGQAKKANITIVTGTGASPGLTNILAKYGANMLDQVETIKIRYAIKGGVYASPHTLLNQLTKKTIIYREKNVEVNPFSGSEEIEFLEPIGKVECYYALQSEIATIPRFIKGVKEVDHKVGFPAEMLSKFKPLIDLGLTSRKPVEMKGVSIEPIEFLLACIPFPKPKEMKDTMAIRVEVLGRELNKEALYLFQTSSGPKEDWSAGGTSFITGVSASIVVRMLAEGNLKARGVFPPEGCVDPEPFLAELTERRIDIHETFERTRIL